MEVLATIVYEKLEPIGKGQGKMSEVWRAMDKYMGGECAIKEIPKQKLRDQNIQDFFQEAKIMFASGHPSNVVPIKYACDCPNVDIIALCMPLYRNGSLLDETRRGPIRPRRLLKIAHGILNGLQKIHTAGFIHFDLKPSNVLFSDSGAPMVADFGQTRPIEKDGTAGMPWMYPGGLPPEFYSGSSGTIRTDVFHFGLLLYRAANGEPFFGLHRPSDFEFEDMVRTGRFPNTNEFMPHVPRAIRTVIRKAVSLDPKDRYRTAADLEHALTNVSVAHDWATELLPNEEITWRSRPSKSSGIDVALRSVNGAWDVTVRNSGSQRRRKKDCRGGLTRKQAMAHLKHVFSEME